MEYNRTSTFIYGCCCCFNCTDEFEDEGIVEKSTPIGRPQTKSNTATAGTVGEELSASKESRKESRRISVGVMESKKRTREDEEYIPQPVHVDHSLSISE